VKQEIFRYVRVMVAMAGCGILLAILSAILWFLEVA
jgi:hypothetical protein